MAILFNLKEDTDDNKKFSEKLRKTIQSACLNFLIGAGCSCPALKLLGNVETEIQNALGAGNEQEAIKKTYDFLVEHFDVANKIRTGTLDTKEKYIFQTLNNYKMFLNNIAAILFERKSNILHKQANIFSTNYDLFVESAMNTCDNAIILNDGFVRTPRLDKLYPFSTANFFNTVSNTGVLYNYQYELPTINLLKLHGSMNWTVKDNTIVQSFEHLDEAEKLRNTSNECDMKKFNNCFFVVFPQKDKFEKTVINNTYYDLFRIYANELDKENVVLLVDGFSFADEHILEITKRALKNPTLQLIVFCFSDEDKAAMISKFAPYRNVDICFNKNDNFDFCAFNTLFSNIVPKSITHEDDDIEF